MKLRTRLFVSIGLLFFLAFGLSLFFEMRTTDQNLKEAELSLRGEILKIGEERRGHIEEYLHVAMSEDQAQIDALLLSLSRNRALGANFLVDAKGPLLEMPIQGANLFKNNRWLDYIQITIDGELKTLLIPLEGPMEGIKRLPIDRDSGWVTRQNAPPLLAIRSDLEFWILFDPLSLPSPLETDTPFSLSLNKAISYVKERDGGKDWLQKEISSKEKTFSKKASQMGEIAPSDGIRCLKKGQEPLTERMIELLQRSTQARMIETLTQVTSKEQFGPNLFSPKAPKGVAYFDGESREGYLLQSNAVFYKTPFFDDHAYFQAHPPAQSCDGMASSLAIITSPDIERTFIANTIEVSGKKRNGLLTIGIDADLLVENLVLSVHQIGLLVQGGKVVKAFDKDGTSMGEGKNSIPLSAETLKTKNGLINWKGVSYYYIQMTPFADLDLHIFLLEPEESAFALVRLINQGSLTLIQNVSFDMRVIAIISLLCVLLLLHRVAKRITTPIAQLAKITRHVASGQLENIELPHIPKKRHDEIETLCSSFTQMIVGLKEKEKVKGILNKVVSPEIAQEIMKQEIHLGGEERKITIFFADIRGFTHMSAKSPPHEVVEMLNNCMTKVSHVIDQYGGVIDKYVGDEVMALFGAPIEKKESALKAIRCGLAILETLKEWNKERSLQGLEAIEMGIGIHTGVVLVGNMGAENRLNYTAIGSNVNFGARLCSSAKPMEILISENTLHEPHVEENIRVEAYPAVILKGYDTPFTLYRVEGEKHV